MAKLTYTPNVLTWNNGFAAADMNSLANNGQITSSLASPHIDNAIAQPYNRIIFEFLAGGSLTPAQGALLVCALVPELSDATYASGTDGTTVAAQYPWPQMDHGIIMLRATAATEKQRSNVVEIRPGRFRLAVINRSGVALPASGNMVKYALFNTAVVA